MISSPENVLAALSRHFGHPGFRPGQDALVTAVMEGHDLLAVMPTGSGKSLGFQLPALLLPGITLVVSPLISLMKDQVDELNRRGLRAAAFHSQLPQEARRDAMRAAAAGDLRLLYVAPERFASEPFSRALAQLRVARFVVDEAHCVSEWGHDFRPDYRRLRAAAAACRRADGDGRPPMAAFTATATPEVRADIVELLGLTDPRVVVAGFDRPNISLRVRPVTGDTEKHLLLPSSVGEGRALVYASTRRKAEEAAETLQRAGHRAAAYHAGLSDAERTRVQDAFAAGSLAVVCATNAFGMGIDRPDVEVVVHLDIPGSLEAYYQEIGRAGRDGRAAVATLFWNYVDVRTREFLIERGREEFDRGGVPVDPDEVQRRKVLEHKKLRRMIAYAETTECLRGTILRYFGDPAAPDACGTCGNCERRQTLDERARLLVRKILSGIARAGERYGRRRITAMLIGDLDELPAPLARLSTTGLLRSESATLVERWIDAACGANLVTASNDEYRILKLTPLGRDVMAGRISDVTMTIPRAVHVNPVKRLRRKAAARSTHEAPDAAPPVIVDALRTWRTEEARRKGIAPFLVLHDRTLLAIAARRPRTVEELSGVSGIGPAKLAEYGEGIVAAIRRSESGSPPPSS